MKDVLTTIANPIELIKTDKPLVIYLEAGHYSIKPGATDFSNISLADAVSLCRYLVKTYGKSVKLCLGILINDLSTNDSIEKIDRLELPKTLQEIIAQEPIIKSERILKFHEVTTKNRGLSNLKKLLKSKHQSLITQNNEEGLNFYIATADEKILIAKRAELNYTIVCPGLMAQHYNDILQQLQKRYCEASSFLMIDWSELLDEAKVEKGRKVFFELAKQHKKTIHILNVFYGDDDGNIFKTSYQEEQ